jgi:hypothetical protein
MEQRFSHWVDFREILYFLPLLKFINNFFFNSGSNIINVRGVLQGDLIDWSSLRDIMLFQLIRRYKRPQRTEN